MSFIQVVCCGAGITLYGGMSRQGELYSVEPNSDLRWYLYNRSGLSSPDGSTGWLHNSRHVIGNSCRFTTCASPV